MNTYQHSLKLEHRLNVRNSSPYCFLVNSIKYGISSTSTGERLPLLAHLSVKAMVSLVTCSSSNIQVSYKNSCNEGEDGVQAKTFVVLGCEHVNLLAEVKQSRGLLEPALIGS